MQRWHKTASSPALHAVATQPLGDPDDRHLASGRLGLRRGLFLFLEILARLSWPNPLRHRRTGRRLHFLDPPSNRQQDKPNLVLNHRGGVRRFDDRFGNPLDCQPAPATDRLRSNGRQRTGTLRKFSAQRNRTMAEPACIAMWQRKPREAPPPPPKSATRKHASRPTFFPSSISLSTGRPQ